MRTCWINLSMSASLTGCFHLRLPPSLPPLLPTCHVHKARGVAVHQGRVHLLLFLVLVLLFLCSGFARSTTEGREGGRGGGGGGVEDSEEGVQKALVRGRKEGGKEGGKEMTGEK